MNPIADVLRKLREQLAALRAMRAEMDAAMDAMHDTPPERRPGDGHSRKVVLPAESAPDRAFRYAKLFAGAGMPEAAALALLGSTCPTGHCRIVEEP